MIGRTIDRGADQEQKTSANERERTRRTRAGEVKGPIRPAKHRQKPGFHVIVIPQLLMDDLSFTNWCGSAVSPSTTVTRAAIAAIAIASAIVWCEEYPADLIR